MNEAAQIILALGVAGLLLLMGAVGLIWSVRCSPRMPHYRLPALIAVSLPVTVSIIWALTKLG